MVRDTSYPAILEITSTADPLPAQGLPALEVVTGPSGLASPPLVFPVGVGRCMSARLFGSGFEVAPAGPVDKNLGASSIETWDWQVTPRRKGNLRLTVDLRIKAYVNGRCIEQLQVYPPQTQSVAVTVGFWAGMTDWLNETSPVLGLAKGWLIGLTALLTAAMLLIGRVRRFLRALLGRRRVHAKPGTQLAAN
ncbi:hypothetical protein SH591_08790 [Sphingomonas sp. LY54]|uniref:hypothetical protein n=1 Tax=Sphingomonas sp. LY54 TaxID=3095343 RepID=UPI002D772DBF|nr:hypothetical protein [Sphingomonas sp. LY54]WRP27220.1 hypothetical protein SH591_08790 [Sphingomonas sp. LY54]